MYFRLGSLQPAVSFAARRRYNQGNRRLGVSYEPTLRFASVARRALLRGRGQRRRSESSPHFQADPHGPDSYLQCRTGLHPLALSHGQDGSDPERREALAQRRRDAKHARHVGTCGQARRPGPHQRGLGQERSHSLRNQRRPGQETKVVPAHPGRRRRRHDFRGPQRRQCQSARLLRGPGLRRLCARAESAGAEGFAPAGI